MKLTTPDTFNVELAEKVLDQITKHPETHDQRYYTGYDVDCGTSACVAGWAVLLDHRTTISIEDGDLNWDSPVSPAYLPSITSRTGEIAVTLLGIDDGIDGDLPRELFAAEASHRKTVWRLRSLIRQAKRHQRKVAFRRQLAEALTQREIDRQARRQVNETRKEQARSERTRSREKVDA
jgi:hypothetical protein